MLRWLSRRGSEPLPEGRERDTTGAVIRTHDRNDYGLRVRRGRKYGRVTRQRLSFWTSLVALFFLMYLSVFGTNLPFHGEN
uniref:Uncharacterized protein n=1 Tax=Nelumbo nucifera TaxID=4432 RepID=A0A822YL01_NELNU|nr:TPA_asm: hypothetical protein HUJ06_005494 [Nelumbo nucifera]